MSATCEGCGVALPPQTRGRPRKWCSERCRNAQYGGTCEICGERTSPSRGVAAPDRCHAHRGDRISARMEERFGPRRDQLAALYRDGVPLAEIARRLGYANSRAASSAVKRLRDLGYDVPCRTPTAWNAERVIAAIRAWAATYGEAPAGPDWQPYAARWLGDETRARRFEQAGGRWPTKNRVIEVFGSWNAAIVAAGYDGRAPFGDRANYARRRAVRGEAA